MFVLGSLLFGGGCLGAGFLSDHVGLIILRAIQGVGAAHTIPSSLRMIIQMMPEPKEQQWAIGLFGVAGGIANGMRILGRVRPYESADTESQSLGLYLVPSWSSLLLGDGFVGLSRW